MEDKVLTLYYDTRAAFWDGLKGQQVTADRLFSAKGVWVDYDVATHTHVYVKPNKSLLTEIAKEFVKAHWSKVYGGLTNSLVEGEGDLSNLQCFIVSRKSNGDWYHTTCLSGPAYLRCKRDYLKSLRVTPTIEQIINL